MLPFSGQFPPNCQRTSLSTSLKLFVTNLLYGSSERVQDDPKEQTSLSIAQLIYFQTRRYSSVVTTGTKHQKEREPPLVLYNLGVSVSYDRVLQVNHELAQAVVFEGCKSSSLVDP